LTTPQQAPGVNGTERLFQIRSRGDVDHPKIRECPFQDPLQLALVAGAGRLARGGRARVEGAADFEFRGPRLTDSLHRQLQRALLFLRVQNPADSVALLRPQVE